MPLMDAVADVESIESPPAPSSSSQRSAQGDGATVVGARLGSAVGAAEGPVGCGVGNAG